jgi:hypothetical protein
MTKMHGVNSVKFNNKQCTFVGVRFILIKKNVRNTNVKFLLYSS